MDMFLFQGGDCSEGPLPDKMVGFAWSPWSGPQDGAGTRAEGSPTQVGGPDRLSPRDRLCEVLTPQLKHGGNRGRTSSELQQTAPLPHSLQIAKLIAMG